MSEYKDSISSFFYEANNERGSNLRLSIKLKKNRASFIRILGKFCKEIFPTREKHEILTINLSERFTLFCDFPKDTIQFSLFDSNWDKWKDSGRIEVCEIILLLFNSYQKTIWDFTIEIVFVFNNSCLNFVKSQFKSFKNTIQLLEVLKSNLLLSIDNPSKRVILIKSNNIYDDNYLLLIRYFSSISIKDRSENEVDDFWIEKINNFFKNSQGRSNDESNLFINQLEFASSFLNKLPFEESLIGVIISLKLLREQEVV